MADQNDLTNEELAAEIRKGNNRQEHLCVLCERFKPLVQRIARQYNAGGSAEDLEDLEQTLFMELCTIIPRYDPYRGAKLLTFIFPWLHNAARKARQQLFPVRVPPGMFKTISEFRALVDQGYSLHEIRKQTGWSRASIAEIDRLSKTTLAPMLSTAAEYTSEDGEPVTLEDLLTDPVAERAYQYLLNSLDDAEIMLYVSSLPEPYRTVIYKRFLSDQRATVKGLAEELQLSVNEIRAAQRRGLKMIKNEFRRRGIIEGIAYSSTGQTRMQRTYTSNTELAALQLMGEV